LHQPLVPGSAPGIFPCLSILKRDILQIEIDEKVKIMKQYRLPVIMHQPNEETEDKYMAEIPSLTGCRAWGETPAEALENLRNVAEEFIRSFKEHGQLLPKQVEDTAYELVGTKVAAELTVYL
jgi:predicted RNase H-like HicB family nuclease